MKSFTLSAIALALVIAVAAEPAAAGYRITTIDAPATPGLLGTSVEGINNNGVVSGYYVLAGDPSLGQPPISYFGFTANADGSNFTSYTRPGHEQTGAVGINDAGTTVGVSVLTYGTGYGYARSASGVFTTVDPAAGGLPAVYSEVLGINNAGDMVGFYTATIPPDLSLIPAYSRGFKYVGGVYSAFDVAPATGFGTQLFSINNAGVITGGYRDTSDSPRGFILQPDGSLTVPTLGWEAASGIGAINDHGDFGWSALVPSAFSPTGYLASAFLVSGGSFTPFAVPGAFSTEIFGVNNRRDLTGYYLDATGLHGFSAVAVPEPANWAMLIAGFGLVGAMQRRRRVAAA